MLSSSVLKSVLRSQQRRVRHGGSPRNSSPNLCSILCRSNAHGTLCYRQRIGLVVRYLGLVIKQQQEELALTLAILASRKLYTSEMVQELKSEMSKSETSAKLKAAVAAHQGFAAIRSILKDFEGTLQ